MRHLKRTAKLGRTSEHRNAMLANLVCSLIRYKRVTTTLAKAKAARSVAEKMVTLGKAGTLHARRLATSRLRFQRQRMLKRKALVAQARKNDVVRILFDEIAPVFKNRHGGYTRIVKLHRRQGDAADLAILEWVELPAGDVPAAPISGETAAAAPASPPVAESKPESEPK